MEAFLSTIGCLKIDKLEKQTLAVQYNYR